MGNIIIRNDDVNPNSNSTELAKIYHIIKERIPNVEVWSCINFLAKRSDGGSVYPDLPLKNHPLEYFYDIDRLPLGHLYTLNLGTIVSHGLLHADHAQMSVPMQEMSIVTSCAFLKTKIFVPPYSSFNGTTERICKKNGIRLVKPSEGWKSLESEQFDPNHKLWFFHSWRFTPEQFAEKLHKCL